MSLLTQPHAPKRTYAGATIYPCPGCVRCPTLLPGGKLRAAKVARRKGPDGKLLSAGFGFVECSSEEVASAVIKALQVCGWVWGC